MAAEAATTTSKLQQLIIDAKWNELMQLQFTRIEPSGSSPLAPPPPFFSAFVWVPWAHIVYTIQHAITRTKLNQIYIKRREKLKHQQHRCGVRACNVTRMNMRTRALPPSERPKFIFELKCCAQQKQNIFDFRAPFFIFHDAAREKWKCAITKIIMFALNLEWMQWVWWCDLHRRRETIEIARLEVRNRDFELPSLRSISTSIYWLVRFTTRGTGSIDDIPLS